MMNTTLMYSWYEEDTTCHVEFTPHDLLEEVASGHPRAWT